MQQLAAQILSLLNKLKSALPTIEEIEASWGKRRRNKMSKSNHGWTCYDYMGMGGDMMKRMLLSISFIIVEKVVGKEKMSIIKSDTEHAFPVVVIMLAGFGRGDFCIKK